LESDHEKNSEIGDEEGNGLKSIPISEVLSLFIATIGKAE
jgi:hypothetical protein